MVMWHKAIKRKLSGGKTRRNRDKRKSERGRAPSHTKVSDKDVVRKIRVRSGNSKLRALNLSIANVLDPKTNKVTKAKIKKVIENRASRHFARMAVITKGAVLDTDAGKARVTNRPGQEGTIHAVLIE
jgi:small subunit ribosomal protein S8e